MITKERFIEFIVRYIEYNKKLEKLHDIIGFASYDNYFTESYWTTFEELLKSYFKEEGFDDIMWWLLEKDNNPEMKMYDKNGEEIPTETLEDLWNIVESNRI